MSVLGRVLLGEGADPDTEACVFAALRLRNGVSKTTSRDRLGPMDELLLRHLPDRPVRILDMAASAGFASAELRERLRRERGEGDRLDVSDELIEARLLRGPGFEFLWDRTGFLLAFSLAGRAQQGSSPRPLRDAVLRVPRIAAAVLRLLGLRGRPVRLLLPGLAGGPGERAFEEDVFAPPAPDAAGAYDVVRLANLLNGAYFPDERLALGLTRAAERVRPGGLLLVGNTTLDTGRSEASLYRVGAQGRLDVVDRLGSGSETERLIHAGLVDVRSDAPAGRAPVPPNR